MGPLPTAPESVSIAELTCSCCTTVLGDTSLSFLTRRSIGGPLMSAPASTVMIVQRHTHPMTVCGGKAFFAEGEQSEVMYSTVAGEAEQVVTLK